ncbi:YgaP family membrane protein [Gracilimonas mengyeensis]|uniref:YgaP family membrane protein n=1 Tax=Gracilimonas mengyeensis TaxID=1302730 RepID=UPI00115B5D7E|nr:DUF2892 domain-containing protein [Gracilimonas mengyeensis]
MDKVTRTIRLFAGFMVTLSVLLAHFISPYWLLLTLFVGLNMMQSTFSGWCLADQIVRKFDLGFREGKSCKL